MRSPPDCGGLRDAASERTGLGRTTFYHDPTIRAVIEEHRHRTATGGARADPTDEIATLRAGLDALANSSATPGGATRMAPTAKALNRCRPVDQPTPYSPLGPEQRAV